jgi:hypothetical protein
MGGRDSIKRIWRKRGRGKERVEQKQGRAEKVEQRYRKRKESQE